ncbi:Uncharacterised protein [Mycolicibacterium fortuitum]|uniref:Transmembrane protein n=1 Tax=Mycolicibacterium fortuitum TaxID=1766 RepID=A0A378WE74_MYCFO|nr:Uncharacterised protein [Mycolicibacterium fortuitum]
MKDKVTVVLAALVGVVLLVWGLADLTDSGVRCGNDTMATTDQCVESSYSAGTSTVRSVEQQRHDNNKNAWVTIGIGGLMFIGGAFFTVKMFRGRPENPT